MYYSSVCTAPWGTGGDLICLCWPDLMLPLVGSLLGNSVMFVGIVKYLLGLRKAQILML